MSSINSMNTIMNDEGVTKGAASNILIIRLADRRIGFDIYQVEQIVQMMAVGPLVNTPDFIEGIISLRGEIVPLIRLREILNFPPEPINPDMFVIIGKVKEIKIGVIVDGIERVVNTELKKASFSDDFNNSRLLKGLIEIEGDLVEVLEFVPLLGDWGKEYLQRKCKTLHPSVDEESEILRKRAENLAQIEVQEIEDKESWMVFFLNEEKYAVSADFIDEVINNFKITRLPSLPDYMLGIISLHGAIIPIIDTRKMVGIENKADLKKSDEKVIIVLKDNALRSGFLADRVMRYMDIKPEEIETPLITSGSLRSEFIKGQKQVRDDLLIMLDARKMIDKSKA